MRVLRNPGKLRLVFPSTGNPSTDSGVDIVVVPGVGIDHTPGRLTSGCSWMKPLQAAATQDTRVLLFDYHLEVDGTSLWAQLLDQSQNLVQGLLNSRPLALTQKRPLLFICHSLGGLIVKQAVTLQRQSFDDVLAGIVFLGTPHLVTTSAEGWNNLRLLMANKKGVSKQQMDESEIADVISTCRAFEDLGLHRPILSVYERRATKLVHESDVQIKCPLEFTVGVDKCHFELCEIDENDPLYGHIVRYFSDIAQYAPQSVQHAFRPAPTTEDIGLSLRPRTSHHALSDDIAAGPESRPLNEPLLQDASQAQDSFDEALSTDAENSPQSSALVELPFEHNSSVSRNQRFFARHEVFDAVDAAFSVHESPGNAGVMEQDKAQTPKTYVLCGMAGIGKTEVAVEYLFSRKQYFDAVIWINADTSAKLGSQFASLAEELGLSSDGVDEESARQIVLKWLEDPSGFFVKGRQRKQVKAKWLMIFDNADDPYIIPHWLPEYGPGCILVTSKYPCVKENAWRLEHGFEMEPFRTQAASDMLRELSGRQDSASVDVSMRIVNELGGLPLAISQMSAIIRQKHLTLKDFESWYQEDSKQLHLLRGRGNLSTYKETIGTAWAVQNLDSKTQALLKVLAILDPDLIPEEILREGMAKVSLSDYPKVRAEFYDARGDLIQLSLVTRNMATNEYRIHRLVQRVVRESMKDDELHAVVAAAAVLISELWPWVSGTDPTRNAEWRVPIADRIVPHITKLESYCGKGIRDGSFKGTAALGYLFSSYAWYAFERGHNNDTATFALLARIVLLREQADGYDDDRLTHWLGETYDNTAMAAVMTRSSTGIEAAMQWLKLLHERIERYNSPEDTLASATAHNLLGICYCRQDEFAKAAESFTMSLETFRSVEDRPKYSGVFPAVSLAHLHVQQDHATEAEDIILPFLQEHEESLGTDDTTTTQSGQIWRVMGNIRVLQQRFEEAMTFHRRALHNMRTILGDKHYFTGDCYYCLALDHVQSADLLQAETYIDAAIVAYISAPDSEAHAARAYWKKAAILRQIGGRDDEISLVVEEAMKYRRLVSSSDRRGFEDICEQDWIDPIMYWSR